MVKMKLKGGDTILAHPSKVKSLQNMGWVIASDDKPAKKSGGKKQPKPEDSDESVEEKIDGYTRGQ